MRRLLLRVRTNALGMPAASALMPSAVRSALMASPPESCSAASWTLPAFELGGRFAHGDGMPRSAGSLDRMLCSSRIAEIPSTSEWCSFVYIATRPSRSPSIRCHSQSGRSVASRVLCSREHSSNSSRTRPGLGSALCRTWCSMSNWSSSTQTHWPAVLIDR